MSDEKAPGVEALDEGETVHRINAHVYSGTACSACGASYWRCTEEVLVNDSLGCCDYCRDEGGHVVQVLPQVEGLIAEIEQRAKDRACYLFEELARKDQALDEIRALAVAWTDGMGEEIKRSSLSDIDFYAILRAAGMNKAGTEVQRILSDLAAALDAQLNKEDDGE